MPETPAASVAVSSTSVPPAGSGAVAAVVTGGVASAKSKVAPHVTAAAFAWPDTDGWK